MTQLVHAAGQLANTTLPNINLPPDFSKVDPQRNWYYLVPIGSPTRTTSGARSYTGVPTQRTAEEIVRRAQERVNQQVPSRAAAAMSYVRDDGVLDVDTLRNAAMELVASLPSAPSGVLAGIVEAMRGSAEAGRMTGVQGMKAWVGLILTGMLPELSGRSVDQINAWLADGGISLGGSAVNSVELPPVQPTSSLQRTAPRLTNFVRRNKVPLIVGGVAVAGLIAVSIYMNDND